MIRYIANGNSLRISAVRVSESIIGIGYTFWGLLYGRKFTLRDDPCIPVDYVWLFLCFGVLPWCREYSRIFFWRLAGTLMYILSCSPPGLTTSLCGVNQRYLSSASLLLSSAVPPESDTGLRIIKHLPRVPLSFSIYQSKSNKTNNSSCASSVVCLIKGQPTRSVPACTTSYAPIVSAYCDPVFTVHASAYPCCRLPAALCTRMPRTTNNVYCSDHSPPFTTLAISWLS